MDPNIKRRMIEKLRKWQNQGVTLTRMLVQLDRWKKEYNLGSNDVRELRQELGI